jgi:single-strand DNA-binding protein
LVVPANQEIAVNDTVITIVGNVATAPERRRIESTGDTVLNFRVGSTSRRFDKASNTWVDGNSFFVKVSCWRGLAENAYQCVFKGDPVVVTGRISTREYEGEDGVKRTSYEMEATALGHNIARGTSTFRRVRPGYVADAVAEARGESVTDTAGDTGEPEAGSGEPEVESSDLAQPESEAGSEASGFSFGRVVESEPVGAVAG